MDSAKNERLHVIGAAVLALVIVLVGWFLLISPQRSETDDISNQISDAQLQNTTLQTRITQLSGEQKQRGTYTAALAAARKALPDEGDMSSFLRSMQAIGAATSSSVTAVSVGTATPVTAPAAAPAAASASPGSPAAPADAAATSGISEIPISASVTGSPKALDAFLRQLQSTQPRAVLVTDTTLTGPTTGSAATLQLKMTAFVAPAAGATSAVTTAAPGGN